MGQYGIRTERGSSGLGPERDKMGPLGSDNMGAPERDKMGPPERDNMAIAPEATIGGPTDALYGHYMASMANRAQRPNCHFCKRDQLGLLEPTGN